MSQHDIRLDDGRTIRLGWDRPMGTFFAIVKRAWINVSSEVRNAIYEATKEDTSRDSYGRQIEATEKRLNSGDPVVFWLGGDFDEYTTIEKLVEDLRLKVGYEMPGELKQTLIADYQADPPLKNGNASNPFAAFLKDQQRKNK